MASVCIKLIFFLYIIESVFLGTYHQPTLYADDFEGKISELNIWNKPLPREDLKRLIESCGNLEPTPTLLKWSAVSNEMLNGLIKEKPIESVCYNTEKKFSPIYKIYPMKTDSNDAIRICEGLKAELAYPKLIGEFKKWSGK